MASTPTGRSRRGPRARSCGRWPTATPPWRSSRRCIPPCSPSGWRPPRFPRIPRGLGRPAARRVRGGIVSVVRDDHVRARLRGRRRADEGSRFQGRRRLPPDRAKAFRLRLRHHLVHADHRRPGRRGRSGLVLRRRSRRALGRHAEECGWPPNGTATAWPPRRATEWRTRGSPRPGSRGRRTGGTIADAAAPFVGCLFTAVVLGVVETAVSAARSSLAKDPDALRPTNRSSGRAPSPRAGSPRRPTRGCSVRWSRRRCPTETC